MNEDSPDSPILVLPDRRRLSVLVVILLPMVIQTVVVKLFAVNMLVWDEFRYVRLMQQIGAHEPWYGWIWHQHNEHRIVWTKLVMLAHASFSGWNPVVEMYVSALLVGVITFGIWKLYRHAGGCEPLFFLPAALLLCSLAQYMNILYGLMTCHYFTVTGIVWSLVFLLRRTWMGLLAAIAAGFLAMMSTLNAIVIWPLGLLVLLLTRQKWPRWALWILAMIAIVMVYFHGYQTPRQHKTTDLPTLTTLMHDAVTGLGSPLSAGSVPRARALGAVTLLLITVTWLGIVILREYERHAGLIALTLVGLGCVGMMAIGRRGHAVMESKYVTCSSLALVGIYLSLVCLRDYRLRSIVLPGAITLLGVGLFAANLQGLADAKEWRKQRRVAKYLLQNAEIQPPEALAGLFHRDVPGIAAYLRASNFGPFRDPVDALIAPRWRDGLPTAEILADSSIHAEFLCPIDTLNDLDVSLSPTPLVPPSGTIHISLKDHGVSIAHSVTDASTITDLTWIRVAPREPVRDCRGKYLVVDIWSENTAPGSGLHAWTYPIYYAGITRQATTVIDQRNLGFAFNGLSNDLVR